MKRLLTAATAFCLSTCALAQTKWDLPSGYGPNTFQVQNLQWFADEVRKATSGKLDITVHPGGSLFKANEIKRAVQTGQTQLGEFILSGASNENPLFAVDSIPFLATTYAEARKLHEVSASQLGKLLGSQDMKLLYAVPWPGQSLYSKKPVASMADLKGTKMRAYNPSTTRIAELISAQPVTIQLAELPQALATGAVDNFLTSSASGIDSKLYEHVKYFYDVNAWLPRNALVVSAKAFAALDAPTQATVVRIATEAETRGWKVSEQIDDDYVKQLAAKGMIVDKTSAGLKKEMRDIGARMTTDWLRTSGAPGQTVIDAYRK